MFLAARSMRKLASEDPERGEVVKVDPEGGRLSAIV